MDALKQAADHLRAGQKTEAQKILIALVKSDPTNDQAWYLLSYALAEHAQQIDCLKRALRFNPNHAQARARLDKLTSAGSDRPPQTPTLRTKSPASAIRPDEWAGSTPIGRGPARKPSPTARLPQPNNRKWILGGLGAAFAIVVLVAVMGMLILASRQPAARKSAGIPPTTFVPAATMPPTWTQTATRTPAPTATITPTPTLTAFPSPAPPGPTAMAYMLELEGQVMNVRGLDKRQDVPRYVTNRTAYSQHTQTQDSNNNEILDLLRMEWAYKALGILTPDFDLVDYSQKVGAIGAAAVYVPWDKSIYVFGTQFSGAEGWFYVHEYGHALVDQHFDLNGLGVYPQCLRDSQNCMAIRALVEGDATLLMYLWWFEYAGYEEYRDLYYYVPPSSLSPGQKQPPAFAPAFNFPYEKGLEFVYFLHQRGGWASINRAYKNLPASTEQILHPEKYLAGERPTVVNDPPFDEVLGPDFILVNSDSLGEWDTHLVLAYGADPSAQIERETALKAASGWGGDHYQVYHNLDTQQTVMSAHWVWDTQADAAEFNQAMNTYQNRRFSSETFGQGAATCRTTGQQVSCLLTRGRETIWLLTPELEMMTVILGLYP